jgi:predicted amidophosphoribosyltransferase
MTETLIATPDPDNSTCLGCGAEKTPDEPFCEDCSKNLFNLITGEE